MTSEDSICSPIANIGAGRFQLRSEAQDNPACGFVVPGHREDDHATPPLALIPSARKAAAQAAAGHACSVSRNVCSIQHLRPHFGFSSMKKLLLAAAAPLLFTPTGVGLAKSSTIGDTKIEAARD